jgi:transcriptional regulator with XRE-family HTH domain
MSISASPVRPIGDHLRSWRQRRRMSQLDLALEAEISQKHLSFVESGRSTPSRDMVLTLAERLEVPLRERNLLLLSAGYAPVFPERSLDDPAMKAARAAIDLVLKGHEPFPALAIDRHWTMVAANAAVAPLLGGVADPALLKPPVNVLQLSLHPAGLAPHIVNLPDWRAHILARLRHQVTTTGEPGLARLLRELEGYSAGSESTAASDGEAIALPLRLSTPRGILSFITTTTVFGTPVDVTLSELAIEAFFPADEATSRALQANAAYRE